VPLLALPPAAASAPGAARHGLDEERYTHDHVRDGTASLLPVLDLVSEEVIADVSPRHRAGGIRRFLT
jgi:hypothetical protein